MERPEQVNDAVMATLGDECEGIAFRCGVFDLVATDEVQFRDTLDGVQLASCLVCDTHDLGEAAFAKRIAELEICASCKRLWSAGAAGAWRGRSAVGLADRAGGDRKGQLGLERDIRSHGSQWNSWCSSSYALVWVGALADA